MTTKLTNKWEELRSALAYYAYVRVSDEPDVLYQTIEGIPALTSERIALYKGIFSARYIDLYGAEVERIIHPAGKEVYKLNTVDDGEIIIETWGNRTDKIVLPEKITVNDLVNSKAWDHEICFYDVENDVSALGIDMFAFDYTYTANLPQFKQKFSMNGNKPDWWMLTEAQSIYAAPAFICYGNNICLDVINVLTGERLTYDRVTPILATEQREQIHSFVGDMKMAYRILLEPEFQAHVRRLAEP